MSPKLKRLVAVEKMQKTIPELFNAVKNSLDLSFYENLKISDFIEAKHGTHRSSRQRIEFTDQYGIEYQISVFGLYRHNTEITKD